MLADATFQQKKNVFKYQGPNFLGIFREGNNSYWMSYFFGSHGAIKKDETGLVCYYGNVRLPNTEETKWVLWKHGILKIAYKVQDDFTLNIKYCIPCLMLTSMRRALNESRWFCGSSAVEK